MCTYSTVCKVCNSLPSPPVLLLKVLLLLPSFLCCSQTIRQDTPSPTPTLLSSHSSSFSGGGGGGGGGGRSLDPPPPFSQLAETKRRRGEKSQCSERSLIAIEKLVQVVQQTPPTRTQLLAPEQTVLITCAGVFLHIWSVC